MVVGFVSLVLAGAFRTALLSSVPLVCKLVGNVLWRAVWLGELSCYGRKKGGSNEPPILGRFALPSVGVVRHRRRGCISAGDSPGVRFRATGVLLSCPLVT